MSISASSTTSQHISIHPDTALGTVRLTVRDLDRSRAFYERAIGLGASEQADGSLALGVGGGRPLIELRGDTTAPPLDHRASGLYHVAILLPSRRDLALAVARLVEARWPLDGASDHLVSEALYLSDPDGNGIEIYRDRPREQWRDDSGRLQMSTLPLDLREIMGELTGGDALEERAPTGTGVGHVHLQVANLADAEAFYSDVLGFDVIVRGYPGALFVSAGGYHHHLGLNTWHSRGAQVPAPGAVGLRSYEVVLPSAEELDRVLGRVRSAGIPTAAEPAGTVVRDPSGNAVVLRLA